MPLPVSEHYFSEGVWSATGPLGFTRYTCVACGGRLKTWASFKAHRAGPDCRMHVAAAHSAADGPAWQRGEMDAADRDALAALLVQLPDPEPIDTAQWAEETLT